MKILICDDEKVCMERIKSHVALYMQNHFIKTDFFATTDPTAILKTKDVYDLAFLDIQMDGMDGIAVAKELKQRNSKVIVFLITAYEEYLDDAMDLHVFRFFDKPFDAQRLYAGLDKAMEYLDETYVDVFLHSAGKAKKILVDDILLVKTENRKTYVQTTGGEYRTRGSVDAWEAKLPNTFFYAVHKSYLVNLHYVTEYNYSELYIDGNIRVPIASRKQSAFHKYWFEYLRRR